MKKEEKLFEALGGIDPALVADAIPQKRSSVLGKWLPSVACLALACVIGTAALVADAAKKASPKVEIPDKPDALTASVDDLGTTAVIGVPNVTQTSVAATTETYVQEPAIAILYRWEKRENPDRFRHIETGETTFSAQMTEVDAAYIGEKLETLTAQAWDAFDGITRTASVTRYAVRGFDSRYVNAFRFEGDDAYYAYADANYAPETLDELIEVLGMREHVHFGDFVISDHGSPATGELVTTYFDPDDTMIWERVIGCAAQKNVAYVHDGQTELAMTVKVAIPALGYEKADLWLMADGHLALNILGFYAVFDFEVEQISEFLDYVDENCPERNLTVYVLPGMELPDRGESGAEETTMWKATTARDAVNIEGPFTTTGERIASSTTKATRLPDFAEGGVKE